MMLDARFVSKSLSSTVGNSSPGPMYNPSFNALSTIETSPSPSLHPRIRASFPVAGKQTPGPGHYDPILFDLSRSTSIQGKEMLGSIMESTNKLHVASKEQAAGILGAFSPGPKYRIPTTIGTATKVSFPRAGATANNAGAEKLYLGAGLAANNSSFSPGPIYNVRDLGRNGPFHKASTQQCTPQPTRRFTPIISTSMFHSSNKTN